MQLLPDAITVLGSRHGLYLDPLKSRVGLIRFDRFDQLDWFGLRVGVRVGKRTILFPLCEIGNGAEQFTFLDQRLSPCAFRLIGIDAAAALKVTLKVSTPFRPRDPAFSTTPVLLIELFVEPLPGQFRWQKPGSRPDSVELFCELMDHPGKIEAAGKDALDLVFNAGRSIAEVATTGDIQTTPGKPISQRDRLVVIDGERNGRRFVRKCRPGASESLAVAWCKWSLPVLEVQREECPFRYVENYASLDAVAAWARKQGKRISTNADKVDGIVAANDLGPSVNHLLAWTLHSWLACTWWVRRPDGRDWFSVWEGSCYFHSTVDVEFTQAPFYLAVWPELLEIELDFWPEFLKPGEQLLGSRGKDTRFLSHDCGIFSSANGQCYPHEMEVEETANWIIMLYAHSRRTGRLQVIKKHFGAMEAMLRFLIATDTTGNGVPDKGIANTIDDASPAVQFGIEQTYLAVKTLAALETGAILAEAESAPSLARSCRTQARKLRRALISKGWCGDHFGVLLEKSGSLTDPWTGKKKRFTAIPGWNAAHIYTANTLPILDMCGFDLRLPASKIKTDLVNAAQRCLREYGCVHSDFSQDVSSGSGKDGLAGIAANPGWVSMNMLRDLAGIYRGIDFTGMAERYWNWQTLTNSQEPAMFFETFSGNNLKFYPRGVVTWGIFDAVNGTKINRVDQKKPLNGERQTAPDLLSCDWGEAQ